MSNRRSLLISAGILTGAFAGAALMIFARPSPPLREPPSRTPFVVASPVRALEGPIPVHGSGTVRPVTEIDVAAQIGGKVTWVAPNFQSGGRVLEGQVLFRIDDADYVTRVRQAKAAVAAGNVSVLQAEEEARLARAEFERFQRRQGTETGATPLAFREPQLQAARAALSRDSASLADAELALSRTEVMASFTGLVRRESVDLGQLVAPGQPVGRIYAADEVEIVVPLADADAFLVPDLWQLAPGDDDKSVPAAVEARYGDASFHWQGYVDRADAALDEQTRTIDVIVRVPNPMAGGRPGPEPADAVARRDGDHRRNAPPLLVGQFVDVEIQGIAPGRYFVLPRAALQPGNEVWEVRRGGAISIIPVHVLQRDDDEVYVTGGLEGANPVVTGGIRFATEGMAVRLSAATDEPGGAR